MDLILNDPHNAPIPADVSALIATCGALYKSKKVDSTNFEAVDGLRRAHGHAGGGRRVPYQPV